MRLKAQLNRLDPDKVDLFYYYQGKSIHFATVHEDDFEKKISDELNDINEIDLKLELV